jgi:hypothetical protein
LRRISETVGRWIRLATFEAARLAAFAAAFDAALLAAFAAELDAVLLAAFAAALDAALPAAFEAALLAAFAAAVEAARLLSEGAVDLTVVEGLDGTLLCTAPLMGCDALPTATCFSVALAPVAWLLLGGVGDVAPPPPPEQPPAPGPAQPLPGFELEVMVELLLGEGGNLAPLRPSIADLPALVFLIPSTI